jgi:KUP system potassium uptake protein
VGDASIGSPRLATGSDQRQPVAGTTSRRHRPAADANPTGRHLAVLSVTALGVVYGDIGTSPLYAFRACFSPEYGLPRTAATVYGVLSLIVWSLILIVSIKYILVIMRLDNRGEGGIMALLALLRQKRHHGALIVLGLFGTALLYGDGIITPAISVLSAAEGIEVAAPAFKHYVLPLTLLVLFLLFFCQRYGTGRMGGIFGPIMLGWFTIIGVLGALEIAQGPQILLALNPWYGIMLFDRHGLAAFFVLGGVVLTVTGAEALYADLGHFGRRPIRLAWFIVVLPALLLNYFGQGALILRIPTAVDNPFYLMAPRIFLYPLVAIATVATVVASQALISGAFSLTHQCVQLRYSPRVSIVHTSRSEMGQIYIPEVNTALMIGCLLLVIGFGSSSALSGAYGVAVTGTMAVTTVLFCALARQRWRWPVWRVGAVAVVFLGIDLAFFIANMTKVGQGGWVPLAIAAGIFVLMSTWHRGADLLNRHLVELGVPLEQFLNEVERLKPPRVAGTGVFLTANPEQVPLVLQRHLTYNKVLQREVILLAVVTHEVPEVDEAKRLRLDALSQGLYRVRAHYGFMERPDVRQIIARCHDMGLEAPTDDTTYYLGRMRLMPTGPAPMMRWRKRLFVFMARTASSVPDFFSIPPDRVVELGARIEF